MAPPKPKLSTGQIMGKLILRRKLPYNAKAAVNMRQRWHVECQCKGPNSVFDIPEYYLLRKGNPKVDCGCSKKTIKTIYNQEYRIWHMMHVRTEDPDHVSYKDYGGRGIKVCAEWHKNNPDGKGFDRFLEFVGPRPSPGHTIDRIENNQGYQPYFEGRIQVKWSTGIEQRANQRPRRSSEPPLDLSDKSSSKNVPSTLKSSE